MTTQRVLIVLGVALLAVGLLWPWIGKLGLGRLPGDITFRRDNFSFYFPITTCIVLSALATLIFWLFRK
ncbi:DUF2905 domain-containing protein [Nitrospina gracilis]|uniref:DUF2905 domain-containing protein n=1 Tax=Nitrospina gracilis TaxID=35801 RepID=UPI001F29F9B3|nr:DUF2905 domain-containing protein [Nitrospina gracilis]MCF8721826.1 formate hydrogenlyase subunit 3/multisubunit Na+/H+ antiporter MnhD subunit [Nitrospina gracilis Nb-211]